MKARLVEEVHRRLAKAVGPGDSCLDATAGNGLDSLFLARLVGPSGTVHAIDLQEEAIRNTQVLLHESHMDERLLIHQGCHSQIELFLPMEEKGNLRAIVFNLGYLPKGNKEVTTRKESTVSALRKGYEWLAAGGVMSVLCYRGHEGGKDEEAAVAELIRSSSWISQTLPGSDSGESPVLHWIEKA